MRLAFVLVAVMMVGLAYGEDEEEVKVMSVGQNGAQNGVRKIAIRWIRKARQGKAGTCVTKPGPEGRGCTLEEDNCKGGFSIVKGVSRWNKKEDGVLKRCGCACCRETG